MKRLSFGIGLIVAIVLMAMILVKAYHLGQAARPHKAAPTPDLSSVVALPNGSVLTAPKGTVGRNMVDWLASSDRSERLFELGGREFDGRSIEPTIESRVRIGRGIEILKSHPDVTVSVIGYTAASGDPAADLTLSQARAEWVVKALHDGGIEHGRLTAEGRGGADPIGDNATPDGRARNERVAMLLRHKR